MAYSVEGLGPPWGGSDGPAAPFGKCWLSPGEESEGNMADWTQSPHPEDRVLWGSWRRWEVGATWTGTSGEADRYVPGMRLEIFEEREILI